MKKIIKSLFALLVLMMGFGGYAQQTNSSPVKPDGFSKAVYFDRIGPLKDFPALTPEEMMRLDEKDMKKVRNKALRTRSYPNADDALPKGADAVWQKEMGQSRNQGTIIENFSGVSTSSYPPDCNGSAGPDHYFQTVNVKYSIYEKNGTQVVPPTNLNTLFAGVPGANNNDGDPILLYDDNANRWLAAEFAGAYSNPDYMLIAISVTDDPTGDWYRWSWTMNGFPDYMKFGVWEDGYYMGTNTTNGSDIYVFERQEMLIGGSAPQMVQFNNPFRPNSDFHCVLPADCDGDYAPSGSPGLFLTINDDAWGGGGDELWVFELDVDWTTPGNSTWNRTQQISVSPFDSNFGPTWDNIRQPGTGQKLDAINQILMYRVQYRNFGNTKRIVCNHTVDVDGTDHAGIRWYELEQNGTSWEIRQQGTYAPDQHSRWMGSIAMNGNKDIALGYSISSSTVYPGIRYAGQSAAENMSASGILDIEEGIILEGTISQTGANRWGDYSNISVDPEDDATFWYTTQYMTSSSNKGTKIASLYFAEVLAAQFIGSPTNVNLGGSVNFIDQSMGAPVSWEWTFEGGDPATSSEQNPIVVYNEAGTYDVTLTVTNETGSNTLTKEDFINVTQEVLSVDPPSATVGVAAGSTSLALTVSKFWNATANCDWVTVSPSGGMSITNITINYEENTGTQRECVITFATSSASVDYVLTQEGIAEILTLDPMAQTVDYNASSIEVALNSNTDWSISETCDWMSVTPESGSGDAVLTITYDENMVITDRNCVLHVEATTVSADFTLTQTGFPASIETNIAAETVSAEAASLEIVVTANVDWQVNETCDWIAVSPDAGNDVTTVTISYDENLSTTDVRVCQISFSGGGVVTVFEITQLAKVAAIELNTYNEALGWQQGVVDVEVTSNINWMVGNSCDWITVEPLSGSGNGSFTLSYDENPATAERNCTLYVSGIGLIRELAVVQQGHPDGIDELAANQISLFPNPATNSFRVESEKPMDNIQIIDMNGRLVAEFTTPGSKILIQTTDWKQGTYFVQISQNKTIVRGTVVIK